MDIVKDIRNENSLFWKYSNIVVIVFAGLIYAVLASFEVFWYDEAYTAGMIIRDFSEIFEITSQDVHTPFYYCVLKLFVKACGGTLQSIKYFSLLFFMGYILLGSKICRKYFNRKIEFFWLILSCFMPAMVIQSTGGRMYTFALFWVTLSAYLAYSLYYKENWGKWCAFVVTTIISVYIHTFSMLEMVVIYLLFIVAVLRKKRYKTFRNILIAGVIVSCSYIPWLLVLFKQFSRWAGWESGWSNTINPFSIHSIWDYLSEWFSSIEGPQPIVICVGLFVFVLSGIYAVKYIIEQKNIMPALGLIVALIVLGMAVLVTILIVPCFLGRYLFPLAGCVWLFTAVGIYRMRKTWIQALLIIAVLLCGAYTYYVEYQLEDEDGLQVYQQCIAEEWQEGDIIMADSYFALMMSIYYPDAEYMVYGYMHPCLPFKNCEAFTKWEQLEGADTVWHISFADFKIGDISEKYECVETISISFSYYDIILERCERRE